MRYGHSLPRAKSGIEVVRDTAALESKCSIWFGASRVVTRSVCVPCEKSQPFASSVPYGSVDRDFGRAIALVDRCYANVLELE